MASAPEKLEAAILALPREERARLAERLIASLDGDEEIQKAWRDEAERRLRAYRDDDMDAIPANEVLDEARERTDS